MDEALSIYYCNIVINLAASIITLFLIWYMRRNNSLRVNTFMKCIVMMTVGQLVFDCALILEEPCGIHTGNAICTSVFVSSVVFGGISAATWSLVCIFLVAFMVLCGRKPTVNEINISFLFILIFATAPAIQAGIAAFNADMDYDSHFSSLQYYYYCRTTLALLGILLLIWLYWKMLVLTKGKDKHKSTLYHLLRKIMFYPVIQVFCRIGAAPHFLVQSTADIPSEDNRTWLYAYVLTVPMGGFLSFLVFVYVQPGAKENLCRMMRLNCTAENTAAMPSKPTLNGLNSVRNVAPLRSQQSVVNVGIGRDDQFGYERNVGQHIALRHAQSSSSMLDYSYEQRESSTMAVSSEIRPSVANDANATESVRSSASATMNWDELAAMDESDLAREWIAEEAASRVSVLSAPQSLNSISVSPAASNNIPSNKRNATINPVVSNRVEEL